MLDRLRAGLHLSDPLQFAAQPASSTSSLADSPAYSLQGSFSPIISQLMLTYNTNPPTDELTNAQNQLAQVKDIMVQNVEQILSRGERIELLVDKTDNMASQATAFRRGARTVRRQMWWKNTRILALSVVVAVVSIPPYLKCPRFDHTFVGSHLDHCRAVLRCRSQSLSLVIMVDNPYCYVLLGALLSSFLYDTYAVHLFRHFVPAC